MTSTTVNGASGTGVINNNALAVTGCTFNGLDSAIVAAGGNTTVGTSTIDGCGKVSAVAPMGAVQIAGGTAQVTFGTITNSPYAIAYVAAGQTGTGTFFKFNTLTDNASGFIASATAGGVLDATNNWWGSDAGPTVSSTAIKTLTNPWLLAPVSSPAIAYGPGAVALNGGTPNIPTAANVNVAITAGTTAPVVGANIIAAATYDGNPVTATPPADTVRAYDVYIQGAAITDVATLTFFGITNPNARVYAYSGNQLTYVLCSNQRVDMFQGAVVVTVNGTGVAGVTSPNLGNMVGLEFVLTEPSYTPPAAPGQGTLVPAQAAQDVDVELTSFSWGAVAGAVSYDFELAVYLAGSADPFIPSLTILSENLDTNGIILLTEVLDYLETYAWRVRTVRGTDDVSAWTTGFFTTMAEPEEPPADPVWIIEQEPTQIEWPDNITIEVPPIEQPEIPEYILWVVVAVGAILVIAVVVLIVRTRRVA
jgi:hypothetical protein